MPDPGKIRDANAHGGKLERILGPFFYAWTASKLSVGSQNCKRKGFDRA